MRHLLQPLLALLVVGSSAALRNKNDPKANLFEPADGIVEHDENTLKAAVGNGEPWLVDFYAPWCGHCQHFAPVWKEVAKQTSADAVKLGAVNCIKQKKLCQDHEIKAFPGLRAYNIPGADTGAGAGTPQKDGGVEVYLHTMGSASAIMAWIKERMPAKLPAEAAAGALSGPKSLDVAEPGGGAAKAEDAAPLLAEPHVHKSENEPAAVAGGVAGGGARGAAKEKMEGGLSEDDNLCKFRLVDAASSIRFALSNNIFTEANALTPAKLDALLAFVDLLSRAFPDAAARASLAQLASDLRSKPSLHLEAEFDSYIAAWKLGAFPMELEWPAKAREVALGGHGSGAAAFSSGLWSLFHLLSTSGVEGRPPAAEVMEGVRIFVDKFFGCAECRRHFLTMYHNCDNGRCCIANAATPAEAEKHLALWLWRAHNSVNSRLAGATKSPATNPMDPHSYAWPREERCPSCWKGVRDFGPPIWDKDEVYRHLLRAYRCGSGVSVSQKKGGADAKKGGAQDAALEGAVPAGAEWVTVEEGEDDEEGSKLAFPAVMALLLLVGVTVGTVRALQARRVGRQKKVADYSRFGGPNGAKFLMSPAVRDEVVLTSPPGAAKPRFFHPSASWSDGHRRRSSSPGIFPQNSNGNGNNGNGNNPAHILRRASGGPGVGWVQQRRAQAGSPLAGEDRIREERDASSAADSENSHTSFNGSRRRSGADAGEGLPGDPGV